MPVPESNGALPRSEFSIIPESALLLGVLASTLTGIYGYYSCDNEHLGRA